MDFDLCPDFGHAGFGYAEGLAAAFQRLFHFALSLHANLPILLPFLLLQMVQ